MILVVTIAGLLASASPVAAAMVCTPAESRAIENRVHVLINEQRTSRGLAPLGRIQGIDQMAQDWSVTMYRTGTFEHREDIGTPTPGNWYTVGENIVMWQGYSCDVEADAQRAVTGWMNSPGHRENILRPEFTHVGYGFYSGTDPQWGSASYGTQNFAGYTSSETPPATSTISITPTSGPAGTAVTVQGQGYPAGFRVNILFGPSQELMGHVTTDGNGSFVARVTVPQVAGGAYVIRARMQNGQTVQDQTFRVTSPLATLSLSPTTVSPGGVVSFSGTNFQPGERVDIRWGSAYGDIIGYVTARSDGSISGKVTARATSSGTYKVVARGTVSSKAVGANLYVTGVAPLITVSPTSAPAGTVVSFSGQGFNPGEQVNITWDTHTGKLLGYVRAGADGTISGKVTVPANATAGTHYLYARGQTSSITVRRGITITVPQAMATVAMEQTRITLGQSGLAMGQSVALTGQGYQPGEKVSITVGQGTRVATVTADSNGRFSTTITIPDAIPYADQPQVLRATGADSKKQAEAPFTVSNSDRADVSLSPEQGPASTVTTVIAHGYAPGEEVTIRATASNGTVLATAKADDNGTVTTEVTIPASDGAATVDLIVVGADGVLLGKGTFTLTAAVEGTPTATEEPNVTEPPATPAPVETEVPGEVPTEVPTEEPVSTPTEVPTEVPVDQPTEVPVEEPTEVPTGEPAPEPTKEPTAAPTGESTEEPLDEPDIGPTSVPSGEEG
jgi:uncharacterized protein YkwD